VAARAPGRAYWLADGDPYEMRDVLTTVRAAFVAEGLPVTGDQPHLPRLAGVVEPQPRFARIAQLGPRGNHFGDCQRGAVAPR